MDKTDIIEQINNKYLILEKVSTEVMLNLCFHLFPVQSYEKK